MSIKDIVDVTISRDTKTTSKQGFGVVLIVGSNPTFSERIKYYNTDELTELSADLADGEDAPEYEMARMLAVQNPRPTKFAVARKDELETYPEVLDAVKIADYTGWYALAIESRTLEDQKAVADWVETSSKIFFTASDDENIIDTTLTEDIALDGSMSIAAYVKDQKYARTAVVYHHDASNDYPELGLLGVIVTRDAGSYTVKFKTAKGVSSSPIDTTEQKNITDKMCNVCVKIGGHDMFLEGTVGEGEFIDVIIFSDWQKSEIASNVFFNLKRRDKVPFTNTGIASIQSEIDKALKLGQNRGGISPHDVVDGVRYGGYEIIVPNANDIPREDKANRLLTGVEFTAFLSGAIHATKINGVLTL